MDFLVAKVLSKMAVEIHHIVWTATETREIKEAYLSWLCKRFLWFECHGIYTLWCLEVAISYLVDECCLTSSNWTYDKECLLISCLRINMRRVCVPELLLTKFIHFNHKFIKIIKMLECNPSKGVVIIGDMGTGKSTFINAVQGS